MPESLVALVRSKYAAARASGALTFANSSLALVHIAATPYQLRYCPSLARKPEPLKRKESPNPTKPFDPFEDPAEPLFVGHVPLDGPPSHILVLNKFPIIENHFILATKTNRPQTHLLEAEDLARTYECLKEWENPSSGSEGGGRLFAFFNSGGHSGASQPHRHVQFLPVEDMKASSPSEWGLLADDLRKAPLIPASPHGLRAIPSLPFTHFARLLPTQCDSNILWSTYALLYKAAAASVRRYIDLHEDGVELHSTEKGDLPISYNMAMTLDCMVLCPRRSEGRMVQRKDGSDIDYVALNGTFLGGTMMVKNEELWHVLQSEPQKLASVIESIGFPQELQSFAELDLSSANFPELRGESTVNL